MEMRPFGKLIPWSVARDRLLRAARPIESVERIPLADACGRTAAETVRATRSVPPFPRATWDGYALRSRETRSATPRAPVSFRVVGQLFADQQRRAPVPPGTAVAIATGARLPPGVDTVEIFERVRRRDGAIEVDHPLAPGRRIAHTGDDIRAGARVIGRGETLLPAALGGLAASGRASVRVYRAPVVSILPNGNELLLPGERPRPGRIYESNNVTLSAIVRAAGGIPRPQRPVRDEPRAIERALRDAARVSDVVVATGGSSVGEHDFLPDILPRLGRLLFHGIAVRPGKPTLASVRGRTLFVGMPGHPTSCLANGYWLLLPTLRKIARRPGPGWIDREVRLARDAEHLTPHLATVIPVRVEGDLGYPTFHDSHAITSLANVDGFAILPSGDALVRKGDRLRVHRLLPPLGRALV